MFCYWCVDLFTEQDVSESALLLAARLGQPAHSNPFSQSLQGRQFNLHQMALGLSSQRVPPLGVTSSRGTGLLGGNPFASGKFSLLWFVIGLIKFIIPSEILIIVYLFACFCISTAAYLQHARDLERNQLLQSSLLGNHGPWPSAPQMPPQVLPGLGRSILGAAGHPSSSSHMPGALRGGGQYPFLHNTGSQLGLSTQNRLLAAALQQQISLQQQHQQQQQRQQQQQQQQRQGVSQQATSLAAAAPSRASPTGPGIINVPPAAATAARIHAAVAAAARPEMPVSVAPAPSFARRPSPTAREPLTMYISCDNDSLTAYQCLARKQIELFEAGPVEVEAGTQGRNRTIILGQVGIRCRHCSVCFYHSDYAIILYRVLIYICLYMPISPNHCAEFISHFDLQHLSLKERSKGSTFYPSKLSGLYQAAQNMTNSHLAEHCQHVPAAVREELAKLGNKKSSAGGGKDYWASGARMLGVIEDDHGLRFDK